MKIMYRNIKILEKVTPGGDFLIFNISKKGNYEMSDDISKKGNKGHPRG